MVVVESISALERGHMVVEGNGPGEECRIDAILHRNQVLSSDYAEKAGFASLWNSMYCALSCPTSPILSPFHYILPKPSYRIIIVDCKKSIARCRS